MFNLKYLLSALVISLFFFGGSVSAAPTNTPLATQYIADSDMDMHDNAASMEDESKGDEEDDCCCCSFNPLRFFHSCCCCEEEDDHEEECDDCHM
ncbi:MAG: hypothetical protein KDK78_07110 [Chlamydiia bacterium]|nr:hypothetical protein [Chlamydiia bacterium]